MNKKGIVFVIMLALAVMAFSPMVMAATNSELDSLGITKINPGDSIRFVDDNTVYQTGKGSVNILGGIVRFDAVYYVTKTPYVYEIKAKDWWIPEFTKEVLIPEEHISTITDLLEGNPDYVAAKKVDYLREIVDVPGKWIKLSDLAGLCNASYDYHDRPWAGYADFTVMPRPVLKSSIDIIKSDSGTLAVKCEGFTVKSCIPYSSGIEYSVFVDGEKLTYVKTKADLAESTHSLSPGVHNVEVQMVDGFGNQSAKTANI